MRTEHKPMANERNAKMTPQASLNGHAPMPDDMDDTPSVGKLDDSKLINLLLEHPKLQRAIKREGEADATRHGFYDVLLAEVALLAHWDDAEIIALIREANNRSSRPQPNIAYCRLVIQEARLKTKTGNLDFAREAILMSLSDTWKVDIRAVIRHGTENSLWHLQLENGQEIQLGTSQDLMSQTKVRTKIFDVTQHMIPRYSPKDAALWDHHIGLLANAAITIDTPEMTRLGQARSYVLGYIQAAKCELDRNVSSEDLTKLLKENKPCVHNGMLMLSARQLLLHHVRLINPKLTEAELLDLLRLMKGKHKRINIFAPHKTSRSLWFIPTQSLAETSENEDLFAPQVIDE
jgi:hypothetical protein